jgi:hypothetical protein
MRPNTVNNVAKAFAIALNFKESTDALLYEAEHASFDDLPARCDVATVTPTVERLRAFYCVEYLYWYIVPTLGLNLDNLLGPWDVKKDFKRSRAGLTELVGKLQMVADEVVIRSTELAFASPRTSSVSTGSYLSANLMQRKSSVLAALGAATLLRVKLRGPVGGIHVIGATAATCITTTPSFKLKMLRDLLAINERNALRPWT